jgi:hypothetical protein
MKKYSFYRDEDNRWYINLPEFIEQGGSKEELEMVSGADTFLHILSSGSDKVSLLISNQPFIDSEQLHLDYTDPDNPLEGAYYWLLEYKKETFSLKIWLCSVTLFVLGEYPDVIYFKQTY